MNSGWTKRNDSERLYRGTFGAIRATLICPDTDFAPEQHNKWFFASDITGEERINLGYKFGDDIKEVINAALREMRSGVEIVAYHLAVDGNVIRSAND